MNKTKKKKNGYIYCMTTILVGLVKIGKTNNFNERMRLLEENGYRNITGLKRYFAIKVHNMDLVEKKVQGHFKNKQIGNSEFFACDISDVVSVMLKYGEQSYSILGNNSNETRFVARTNKGLLNVPIGYYYYFDKNNKRIATMKIDDNYRIWLCKGSKIAENKVKSLNFKSLREWEKVRAEFVENDKLSENYQCSSISLAISIVLGRLTDGWKKWETIDHKKIEEFRKK